MMRASSTQLRLIINPSPRHLELPETDISLPVRVEASYKRRIKTVCAQKDCSRRRMDPNRSGVRSSNFAVPQRILGQCKSTIPRNSLTLCFSNSTSPRQLCASACILALAGLASGQSTTTSSPSSKTSSTEAATTSLPGGSTNSRLQVVIPIVGGVVVLAIVAILIFIKCAANRQNSRRGRKRRKMGAEQEGGALEYEGVPA